MTYLIGTNCGDNVGFDIDASNFRSAKEWPCASDGTVPPEPGYLGTWTDPLCGGTYKRITDNNGTGEIYPGRNWGGGDPNQYIGHHYGSEDVWNADQSLIWLRLGGLMIDANTCLPVETPNVPGGLRQWHVTDPDLMLVTSGTQIRWWNVQTGQYVQTWDYAGTYTFTGDAAAFDTRRNMSNDGRYMAITGQRVSDGAIVAFVIDLLDPNPATNVILEVEYADYGYGPVGAIGETGAKRYQAQVSATGEYLLLTGAMQHDPGFNNVWPGVTDLNPQGGVVPSPSYTDSITWIDISLAQSDPNVYNHAIQQRDNGNVESPGGHGDMGIYVDANGDRHDTWTGVFKGNSGSGTPRAWALNSGLTDTNVRYDADTGNLKTVGPDADHTSTRNLWRENWAYGSGGGWLWGMRLDCERVECYGRTYTPDRRATNCGYFDEAHASVSRDGQQIIFRSSWGHQWPCGVTEVYILDLSTLV